MNESPSLKKAREIFRKAAFINDLGITLEKAESGVCETRLKITPKHLQQTQVVHAGVLGTLADHSAGGAACSILKDSDYILTAEFKVNLFRPAPGPELKCISRVIKPGRRLIFAESEVFNIDESGTEKLVAKASVTLAVLSESTSL